MDVREKLVELLSKYFDIGDSYCYNLTRTKNAFACGTMGFDDFEEFDDETVADIADHLIAHGVTVQEWIPVSEQKPEENNNLRFYVNGNLTFTTVLVSGNEKGVRIANRINVKPCGIDYLDEYATNGWEWSVGNEDVAHWMPLPKPPKGE